MFKCLEDELHAAGDAHSHAVMHGQYLALRIQDLLLALPAPRTDWNRIEKLNAINTQLLKVAHSLELDFDGDNETN